MRRHLLSLISIVALTHTVYAQWECPSQLGAYLKPVGQSNLFWTGELTGGGGYITNNAIGNFMGLIGLDWTYKSSTLYLEGGYKYWNRNNLDYSRDNSNQHWGVRELYYQLNTKKFKYTLGVQSTKSDDDFLLNERIIGANARINLGKWSINALGGSVTKDFARNGTFCNVGYLYDILPGRNRALIGNLFGQTNLTSISIKFQPSKSVDKKKETKTDNGFSSDEFSQSSDLNTAKQSENMKIESIGAIAYHEFGDWIPERFLTTGLFAQAELGKRFYFKPEILFQSSTSNKAILYNFHLEKIFEGMKTTTTLSFRYIGKTDLDKNAHFLNSFSNVFAGDVIRLDAIDGSILYGGIKCSFPKSKFHLKTQFSSTVAGDRMKELDVEMGKKFGKRLQINLLSGLIDSYSLTDKAVMGRIEFRYYL